MQARTRHTETQQSSAKSHQNEDAKKELKQETADIRGFTLMFGNEAMEAKWNRQYMNRHISITTRYLFAATVFQGLFYWSDVLESDKDPSSLFHLLCLRLLIGGFTLLGCFLVSTGLVVPTQLTVFWVNLCYGFPSLAIFYLARPAVSVYDSFFLVYGLCFFMLPKISPLNFIFGFSGALLFTFLFIYISAFRLSFQQWLLSNTFLLCVVLLFCYISYSAERVSRERWLLRERLKRERINLRIVASSIQDDFTKAGITYLSTPFHLLSTCSFRLLILRHTHQYISLSSNTPCTPSFLSTTANILHSSFTYHEPNPLSPYS